MEGGNTVCHNPVGLLRIPQGPQAVSRLHVADGNPKFHRRQRSRHGGVGIAKNQEHIRPLPQKDLLDLHEHLPGHLSMRSARDAQVVIRLWNVHFLKKHLGHTGVIMLPGVDQHFLEAVPQHAGNHRQLDKLRPRPDYRANLFHSQHLNIRPVLEILHHILTVKHGDASP